MKKLTLMLTIAAFITACNNRPENNGSSTPIDSSNVNGTAGAQYGADNPAAPASPKNEGSNDSGLRANTASSADSANMNLKR